MNILEPLIEPLTFSGAEPEIISCPPTLPLLPLELRAKVSQAAWRAGKKVTTRFNASKTRLAVLAYAPADNPPVIPDNVFGPEDRPAKRGPKPPPDEPEGYIDSLLDFNEHLVPSSRKRYFNSVRTRLTRAAQVRGLKVVTHEQEDGLHVIAYDPTDPKWTRPDGSLTRPRIARPNQRPHFSWTVYAPGSDRQLYAGISEQEARHFARLSAGGRLVARLPQTGSIFLDTTDPDQPLEY